MLYEVITAPIYAWEIDLDYRYIFAHGTAKVNPNGGAIALGHPIGAVITSYSIHYTKLYDPRRALA